MKKNLVVFGLLVIFAILSLQCAKEKMEPLSDQMKQELAILPAGAAGVGFVNIEAVKASPFTSDFKESWYKKPYHDKDYQEFLDSTGLDIEKDVDKIFVSFMPSATEEKPEGVVVVYGTFDPQRIVDYVSRKDDKHEISSESYNDFTIYKAGKKEINFCFPDNSHFVFGSEMLVRKLLDNFANKSAKPEVDPQLLKRVNALAYKNDAWFTLNTQPFMDRIFSKMEGHPQAQRFEGLKSLQQMYFSMKFAKDLRFSGVGDFDDEQKAKLFREAVKGFIATAKLTMSNDRDAVDALNKIEVDQDGNQLKVKFDLTQEDVAKLQKAKKEIAVLR